LIDRLDTYTHRRDTKDLQSWSGEEQEERERERERENKVRD